MTITYVTAAPKYFFKRFPAEIHLVHVKEDYVENPTAALDTDDGLSVLGIFIEANSAFKSVETAWFNVISGVIFSGNYIAQTFRFTGNCCSSFRDYRRM